jgi:hypothetical protein
MTGKSYSPTLILLILAAAAQILAGWNYNGITTILVVVAMILGVANLFKIGISGDSGHRGQIVAMTFITGAVVLFGVSMAGLATQATTASITDQYSALSNQNTNPAAAIGGETYTAKFVSYPSGPTGGTYAGSGVVYLLDPSVASDRYSFMKILADGNTGKLLAPGGVAPASSISVSSGAFTKTQLTAKVNSNIMMCGYLDTTPAQGENTSFCQQITLNGITGGSTPEWMWSFADGSTEYAWRNYATLLWYDSSDAARTIYTETEAVSIEKTFTVYTFPTNDGEKGTDTSLYFEAPSSNAGAIKRITIRPPTGEAVTYTALQSTGQMSSNDPRFIAAPALTTSTDTMYYIGPFPGDAIRASASEKAKYTIEMVYDHPASGSVLTYLKTVQNANAKTVSGGHFDSPTSGFQLNMTATGTDAWT